MKLRTLILYGSGFIFLLLAGLAVRVHFERIDCYNEARHNLNTALMPPEELWDYCRDLHRFLTLTI